MKVIPKIYTLLLALLLFAGCVQEVQIDLPAYQSKIVVNGLISDREVSKVRVSRSISSIDSSPINYIFDASVQLYDEQNNFFDLLSYDPFKSGYYGTKNAIAGQTYTIKVNVAGEKVEGKTSIAAGTRIFNVFYIDSVYTDISGLNIGSLSFSFADAGITENYYRLKIQYYNNSKQEFSALDIADNSFLTSQAEFTEDGYVFSDRTFNGAVKKLDFEVPFGYVTKTAPYLFIISLESLNEDYSKFENTKRQYQNSRGTPFVEAVELYSNIKNGLGIFAGSTISRDTLK